jgi:peptide-methionine (R)-S-oxide reductase
MINRRDVLKEGLKYGVAGFMLLTPATVMADMMTKETFPFQLSDDEWRARLSSEQYKVLRKHGTERSHTSPLDKEKRDGIFHCAGCDHPLFSSAHKFDSGTGWPSFYQPLNDAAIGTSIDTKFFMKRTEVHCANCGGHLGHVFEDGPAPTGLRYCMNGVAMTFKPA